MNIYRDPTGEVSSPVGFVYLFLYITSSGFMPSVS